MGWSQQKCRQRIREFRASAPAGTIGLKTFDQNFLNQRRAMIDERVRLGGRREPLIFDLPRNSAIRVDGVHVYIQMLDFADAMMERDRETEASHRRVLSMLHLNYAACDQVADEFEAQRVDFHGSRMHAVIVSPPGPENARERAERALAFADAAKRAIEEVGRITEGGRYSTRIRIGLDSGAAVAVNSGTKDEREPLFLGAPANYAAKLAEGDEEGVFMSNRVEGTSKSGRSPASMNYSKNAQVLSRSAALTAYLGDQASNQRDCRRWLSMRLHLAHATASSSMWVRMPPSRSTGTLHHSKRSTSHS